MREKSFAIPKRSLFFSTGKGVNMGPIQSTDTVIEIRSKSRVFCNSRMDFRMYIGLLYNMLKEYI
jgi:hypothetical protein